MGLGLVVVVAVAVAASLLEVPFPVLCNSNHSSGAAVMAYITTGIPFV
jgi:hypothetical protein